MTHLPTNIARPLFNNIYLSLLAVGAAILLPGLALAQDEPAGISFDASLVAEKGTFMHIADIDRDGTPDIVVSNEFGENIAWYRNNGNGDFTENELEDIEENARIVRVADMNGDGIPDIIAGRYKLVCYYGDEDLEFEDNTVISEYENNVYDIHISDIDNDGDMDVFVGTITPDQVRWYRNDGGGNYTLQTLSVDSDEGIISHATPDINGDGLPDIVCAYRERDLSSGSDGVGFPGAEIIKVPSADARVLNSKTIVYFINQGSGNFSSAQLLTDGLKHPESVAAADLDGDGAPDILSASTDDSRVAWYRNISREGTSGAFGEMNTISTSLAGVKEAIAADIDGDGDLDVVAASTFYDKNLVWFENNGNGSFSGENLITQRHIRWMDAADMDGDGDIDLMAADAYLPKSVSYYENQRAARPAPAISSFSPQTTQVDSVITITGSNFGNNVNNTQVTIGDKDSEVLHLNDEATQLQARVPDLPPGTYTLQLKTRGQTTTASEKLKIRPYLIALLPKKIEIGNELTLVGTNFRSATNDIQVQLSNTILQESVSVNTAGTEARITLPQRILRGDYHIKIIINGQPSNNLPLSVINPPDPVLVDSTPPAFTNHNLEQVTVGDSVFTFSASVEEDASDISQIIIRSGGIVKDFSHIQVLDADTALFNFSIDIPANLDDPLGMKYQIEAINTIGLTDTISHHAYRYYDLKDSVLYDVSTETPTQSDYRMIAIPFESKAVAETWLGDTIDTYDKRFWRLFRYGQSDYEEYGQSGFSAFEPGRGYMLIRKDFSFDMQGQTTHLSSESEKYIDIPLQAGWNLIGNPYPFAINWSEVVAANPDVAIPQPPKTFRNGSYSNADSLESFEGAFLRNEGEAAMLRIPLSARNAATNSRQQYNSKEADTEGWQIPLTLSGQQNSNMLGGFGMHPRAHEGSDYYDDYAVPRFSNYLDITFANPSANTPPHTKDIVALAEDHVWEFSVNTETQEYTSLAWDSEALGIPSKALWLLDLQNNRRINMREQSSYTFMINMSGSRSFRIFYADPTKINELILPDKVEVGEPYPNPAEYTVNLPLYVPKGADIWATVDIYDQAGRKVRTLYQEQLGTGFHTLVWNRATQNGRIVPPGIYFYKIRLAGNSQIYTGKMVFK